MSPPGPKKSARMLLSIPKTCDAAAVEVADGLGADQAAAAGDEHFHRESSLAMEKSCFRVDGRSCAIPIKRLGVLCGLAGGVTRRAVRVAKRFDPIGTHRPPRSGAPSMLSSGLAKGSVLESYFVCYRIEHIPNFRISWIDQLGLFLDVATINQILDVFRDFGRQLFWSRFVFVGTLSPHGSNPPCFRHVACSVLIPLLDFRRFDHSDQRELSEPLEGEEPFYVFDKCESVMPRSQKSWSLSLKPWTPIISQITRGSVNSIRSCV